MRHFILLLGFFLPYSFCTADPIVFPQGYVPLSWVDYVTPPDPNGYRLVVGEAVLGAQTTLWAYLKTLPALSSDQMYVNQSIELAPGLFFANVLVPTTADIVGDLRNFGGVIPDPMSFTPSPFDSLSGYYYSSLPPGMYRPFVQNIIPLSRLFDPFVFWLGPAQDVSATPEPYGLSLIVTGFAALAVSKGITRSKR